MAKVPDEMFVALDENVVAFEYAVAAISKALLTLLADAAIVILVFVTLSKTVTIPAYVALAAWFLLTT